MSTVLVVLSGLFVRLAMPIMATALVVLALRLLSRQWQEGRGTQQDVPCWQMHRLSNGYLHKECLDCDVFLSAPITAGQAQVNKLVH